MHENPLMIDLGGLGPTTSDSDAWQPWLSQSKKWLILQSLVMELPTIWLHSKKWSCLVIIWQHGALSFWPLQKGHLLQQLLEASLFTPSPQLTRQRHTWERNSRVALNSFDPRCFWCHPRWPRQSFRSIKSMQTGTAWLRDRLCLEKKIE